MQGEAVVEKSEQQAVKSNKNKYLIFSVPLYALTMFLSAMLLFSIQPMFTKMVLPMLGGASMVWNTAMMFFQAVLLAGYGYVHFTSDRLSTAKQVMVHLAIMVIAVVVLPVSVAEGWRPPTENTPIFWLLALFGVSIGLPFFAVTATAPLLQKWFSFLGHKDSHDPYFLYGASNIGSILALVSYPSLIEPSLRLSEQKWLWSGAYVLLILFIASCAAFVKKYDGDFFKVKDKEETEEDAEVIPWQQKAKWVLLAFAPSSLMLGVTSHLSVDVAAVPLFWVVPLALYLLTFVIVFARKPIIKHKWVLAIQPFVYLFILLIFFFKAAVLTKTVAAFTGAFGSEISYHGTFLNFTAHLITFFLLTMLCHGELAAHRPSTRNLTGFYMWISVGGVLGGIFNSLVAPVLFDMVLEYPLVMILTAFLRPKTDKTEPYFSWKYFKSGSVYFSIILFLQFVFLWVFYKEKRLSVPFISLHFLSFSAAVLIYMTEKYLKGSVRRTFLIHAVAFVAYNILLFTVCLMFVHSFEAGSYVILYPFIFLAVIGYMIFYIRKSAKANNTGYSIETAVMLQYTAAFILMFIFFWNGMKTSKLEFNAIVLIYGATVLAMAAMSFIDRKNPFRFGFVIAVLFMVFNARYTYTSIEDWVRSFYGVYHVQHLPHKGWSVFTHGTTVHGAQYIAKEKRTIPITYYSRQGPLGQVFKAMNEAGRIKKVGVMGLGPGTIACHYKKGQYWTFFEIDPVIREIAKDSGYFSYLKDCAPSAKIVMGDGRLSLEKVPDGYFDLLIMDAFSSDSVPVHLITREALELYLSKVSDLGLVAFNVSNVQLNIPLVLGNITIQSGHPSRFQTHGSKDQYKKEMIASSSWGVVAKTQHAFDVLDKTGKWRSLVPERLARPWTDDYSNIFDVVLW